jgi:hypothetical protein
VEKLSGNTSYSDLKQFTGFAIAALIDWELTVMNAMSKTKIAANPNNHPLTSMR